MNIQLTTIAVISLLSANIFGSSSSLAEEAHSDSHHDPHWTYEEQEKWGELSDPLYRPPYPYAACGIGQKQSPVNIETGEVSLVSKFDQVKTNYGDIPLSLSNNGHTIRVNTPKGTLVIGNSEYELAQFHFHAPSEHLVNGVRYPMEIHFVNGRTDGRAVVIGVFIKAGKFNPVFQEILDHAPVHVGDTVDTDTSFRPDRLLPERAEHFYSYAGSLTTPPCSEGVQWLIYKEAIEASEQQIKAFSEKYFDGIARSEQKLNGRKLDAY